MTDTRARTDASTGRSVVSQPRESAAKVRQDAASMQDTATELSAMVVAYARQETIDPIRRLGRYVLFGVLGAVFMGLGGFFLALAAVRALQTELAPHLAHDLSWAPYMAGVIIGAAGAAFAVTRISKLPKGKGGQP